MQTELDWCFCPQPETLREETQQFLLPVFLEQKWERLEGPVLESRSGQWFFWVFLVSLLYIGRPWLVVVYVPNCILRSDWYRSKMRGNKTETSKEYSKQPGCQWVVTVDSFWCSQMLFGFVMAHLQSRHVRQVQKKQKESNSKESALRRMRTGRQCDAACEWLHVDIPRVLEFWIWLNKGKKTTR